MYYLNENVRDLNRIFDQNARGGYLRMDLNENPNGLPQEFINEVLSDINPEFLAKYPDHLEFMQCLGNLIGADVEEICLTNTKLPSLAFTIRCLYSP